jgi:hypothetical protein
MCTSTGGFTAPECGENCGSVLLTVHFAHNALPERKKNGIYDRYDTIGMTTKTRQGSSMGRNKLTAYIYADGVDK